MTRSKALEEAERCFRQAEVVNSQFANTPDRVEANAEKAKALASIGIGWIKLAEELRQKT